MTATDPRIEAAQQALREGTYRGRAMFATIGGPVEVNVKGIVNRYPAEMTLLIERNGVELHTPSANLTPILEPEGHTMTATQQPYNGPLPEGWRVEVLPKQHDAPGQYCRIVARLVDMPGEISFSVDATGIDLDLDEDRPYLSMSHEEADALEAIRQYARRELGGVE